MKPCTTAVAALAALSFAVAAAGSPLSELDPITVTPERSEALLSDTLAPVIVITRADIERLQAADVAELLRLHAGLDVGRNGGPGQPASVFIRGAESNHTLVLVDGVRVNPATIGGAPFQNLAPELIERIEIVKGPRSSQWGSDAIGGVVHILTRRPADGLTGHAHGRGGSEDTWEGGLGGGFAGRGFELGGVVQQLDVRGARPRPDSTLERDHENFSGTAHGAAALGQSRLGARHWQAQSRTEYFDFFLAPIDQDSRQSASALEWSLPAAPIGGRVTLSHVTDDIDQNQPNFLGDFDYATTRRTGAEAQVDWRAGDALRTLVGAGSYREEADALSFGTRFDVETDVRAGFAQAIAETGRHRVLLAGRHTDHAAFGGHTTGLLEYGVHTWAGARVVASAGTAFRAPDATDRFGFGGSADLAPETSRNLELGLRQQLGAHQTVTVAAFHNRIRNLIEFDDPDGIPFSGDELNRNVARARIQGIEAGWRGAWPGWSTALEGSLQDPVDRSTGERLARRSGKSATASLVRHAGIVDVGIDALAQGPREDSAFSTIVNGGYALWNLTTAWRAARGLTLQARLENALDKHYETAAGFEMPDRGGWLTARYAFR